MLLKHLLSGSISSELCRWVRSQEIWLYATGLLGDAGQAPAFACPSFSPSVKKDPDFLCNMQLGISAYQSDGYY